MLRALSKKCDSQVLPRRYYPQKKALGETEEREKEDEVYSINYEYGDDFWREACEIRTHLEAFQEMFGDYVQYFKATGRFFKPFFRYLDLCSNYAVVLKEEEIPQNVPKSHWWWFYKWIDRG